MKESKGDFIEWFVPAGFLITMSWAIWHMPAYTLSFGSAHSESKYAQVLAIHESKDVLALPGLIGIADFVDLLALILIPFFLIWGVKTVRVAKMEWQDVRAWDRLALFFGRVTMLLIVSATLIMLYEVMLRYLFEAPTLWANELTLWIAGYVFLFSGIYAMQQRTHIRIFIIYDLMPRWVQKTCDSLSALFTSLFAFFLVFGAYKQVFITKFYNWEMFGTAFDPPIPATVQPFILICAVLIALQGILNLIADWNRAPEVHTDEVDQDEINEIKKSLET